jgi:hypothetical protein
VKLLSDDIGTNHEERYRKLINANKEVGLEVNAAKTKYTALFHHQNAGQNHDMKIANRCFKNGAQFKYLGAESNKSKLASGGNYEAIEFE